jgi:hypothetical protein
MCPQQLPENRVPSAETHRTESIDAVPAVETQGTTGIKGVPRNTRNTRKQLRATNRDSVSCRFFRGSSSAS